MKLQPAELRDRIWILEAQISRVGQDRTVDPDTRRADLRSLRRQLRSARRQLEQADE